MINHDYDHPYTELKSMDLYTSIDPDDAKRYGRTVRALGLTNREYLHRFNRFHRKHKMKPPPSSGNHIMPGFLVVRKLGRRDQYETWMPDQVFEDLYEKA